jgi:hypothetical protein
MGNSFYSVPTEEFSFFLFLLSLQLIFDQPEKIPLPQVFDSFAQKVRRFLGGTLLTVLIPIHESSLPQRAHGR